MVALLCILVVVTVVSLAVLWPEGKLSHSAGLGYVHTLGARVTAVETRTCALGSGTCQFVMLKLTSGPDHAHPH